MFSWPSSCSWPGKMDKGSFRENSIKIHFRFHFPFRSFRTDVKRGYLIDPNSCFIPRIHWIFVPFKKEKLRWSLPSRSCAGQGILNCQLSLDVGFSLIFFVFMKDSDANIANSVWLWKPWFNTHCWWLLMVTSLWSYEGCFYEHPEQTSVKLHIPNFVFNQKCFLLQNFFCHDSVNPVMELWAILRICKNSDIREYIREGCRYS